jgi:hypothetical protein
MGVPDQLYFQKQMQDANFAGFPSREASVVAFDKQAPHTAVFPEIDGTRDLAEVKGFVNPQQIKQQMLSEASDSGSDSDSGSGALLDGVIKSISASTSKLTQPSRSVRTGVAVPRCVSELVGPTPSSSSSMSSSASKFKTGKKRTASEMGRTGTSPTSGGSSVPTTPIQAPIYLPQGHRPARGRGRQRQLKEMTAEQIVEEKETRNLKNRLAARDCRARKKQHTELLEAQVDALAAKDRNNQLIIKQLRAKIFSSELGEKEDVDPGP